MIGAVKVYNAVKKHTMLDRSRFVIYFIESDNNQPYRLMSYCIKSDNNQ